MDMLDTFAGLLLARLAWTAAQATVLIALVALVIRLRPQLSAATRCLLWWLVGLQLLVGLAWQAPVELHWLAAPAATPAAVAVTVDTAPVLDTLTLSAAHETVAPAAPAAWTVLTDHWRTLLAALWLAGLVALFQPVLQQWREARALRRRSRTLTDAHLQARCIRRAQELGLRRCPQLRVCPQIASPQVIGLRHPVVLLPEGDTLTPEESAMALDHELAHLRRGDLWMAWVPALAQRLFFFHPLVGWAMREYALYREAACDAQVLQQGNSAPQDYGRLLLRLGVAHPLHAGLAGASPTFDNLKRRLTMLQQIESSSRLRSALLVALIAVVGVIPYRVTAADTAPSDATATHSHRHAEAQADLAMPAPPPAAPEPPALAAPPAPPPPPPALAPPPPAPPPPPPPPAPPAPSMAPALPASLAPLHNVTIEMDDQSAIGFAVVQSNSATIRGSGQDMKAVGRLRRQDPSPLLWYRKGDKGFVVRDPDIIARAKAIQAATIALTRKQGAIAGEQGNIAGQEAGMAAREQGLAMEQAALAQRQAALASQAAHDATRASLAEQSRQRKALDHERARVDARHAAMEHELAAQRKALAARRHALSRQLAKLHEHQQEIDAQSLSAMNALITDALAKGKAQPVTLR